MGLFDFLRKEKKTPLVVYAETQNGKAPFYSDFGNNIYASDIIVQSIRCKANEFKKLKPRHITMSDGKPVTVLNDSIARVLRRPNEYMTTADFLEKITILLELNKNCFIYPAYYTTKGKEKVFTALYPLKPVQVTYLQDLDSTLYIKMTFANGKEFTLPASDIIHWRKDYGVNDFFGGGAFGGNDDEGLLSLLDTYDKLLQSLSKALEVSCQINGIMKLNSYTATEKSKQDREKFEKALKENNSGILFTDLGGEYTPLARDVKLLDAETLNSVYQMILRANGTSLAILNGDYTKQQKEAYYEHALEADIISLGQAMSRCLFTDREQSIGHEIVLYPNDIMFMSMENKISYMQIAVPAGAMTKDEIRNFGGLAPLENGDELPRAYNSLDTEKNKTTGANEDEQTEE